MACGLTYPGSKDGRPDDVNELRMQDSKVSKAEDITTRCLGPKGTWDTSVAHIQVFGQLVGEEAVRQIREGIHM